MEEIGKTGAMAIVSRMMRWFGATFALPIRTADLGSQSSRLQKFDDRILLQLSVEPARPLFPLLRKAGAMTPLIALIALLPTLYAFENRTLTDVGALWGLQSLQRMSAADPNEFVDPGAVVPGTPFKWQ